MVDRLHWPRLKLNRADQHIEDLDELLREIVNAGRESVSVELDDDSEYLVCVANEPLTLPNEVPLIIGDAIHNLHSAFDHLAMLLVRPDRTVEWKTQFPFARSAAAFEEELKQRGFAGISPDALDIVRKLKPYGRGEGDSALSGLHELDIVDKHRIVIAVSEPMIAIPYVGIHRGSVRAGTQVFTEEKGRYVARVPIVGNVKPGDRLSPALGVFFGPSMPFALRPISLTLHELARYSRETIESFAPFV